MVQQSFHIIAETGIHARPAALLVQAAGQFSSELQIEYQGKTANLKSILAVLSLGAGQGADVIIYSYGKDEAEALTNLTETMKKEGIIA